MLKFNVELSFAKKILRRMVRVMWNPFFNLPAPKLRIYIRESAIAEKIEAMVKLDILNSCMKDFFDIWLMSRQYAFDGPKMAIAIVKTFSVRSTGWIKSECVGIRTYMRPLVEKELYK